MLQDTTIINLKRMHTERIVTAAIRLVFFREPQSHELQEWMAKLECGLGVHQLLSELRNISSSSRVLITKREKECQSVGKIVILNNAFKHLANKAMVNENEGVNNNLRTPLESYLFKNLLA